MLRLGFRGPWTGCTGAKRDGDSPAFAAGIAIGLADVAQGVLDHLEYPRSLVNMSQLPASEPQGELHPVAPLEKLASVAYLDLKVMLAYLGAHPDLP